MQCSFNGNFSKFCTSLNFVVITLEFEQRCSIRKMLPKDAGGIISHGGSSLVRVFTVYPFVCGTVSSILSGLETRSLGLNTLGKT